MGTAIMAAGIDASAYANNYLPPVTGPLAPIWKAICCRLVGALKTLVASEVPLRCPVLLSW